MLRLFHTADFLMKRFGVSTNYLMGCPLEEDLYRLSWIFDPIEIQCDAKHSLFLHEDICGEFDLRYTIHAPTRDWNIAVPVQYKQPMQWAGIAVIQETEEIVDRSRNAGDSSGFCLYPRERDGTEAEMQRSFTELDRIQEEFSILFEVENLVSLDSCMFHTTEMLATIRECGLSFVLDVGHANLTGTLASFLLERPDHLHDNCGKLDEHTACGTGMVDFSPVLATTWSATMILEVLRYEDVERSLAFLESTIPRNNFQISRGRICSPARFFQYAF